MADIKNWPVLISIEFDQMYERKVKNYDLFLNFQLQNYAQSLLSFDTPFSSRNQNWTAIQTLL